VVESLILSGIEDHTFGPMKGVFEV